MSFADTARKAPRILCTGIIVLDEVFRVDEFPESDGKVEAKDFFVVSGGCAANAAIAIARLGGRAGLAGPMGGPAGIDSNGDRVLQAFAHEKLDTTHCQRIDGYATALSAIFVNGEGDRTIVTYRDARIATAVPANPEAIVEGANAVLADNRFPSFVLPICAAGQRRTIPVVLDGDKATVADDPLFRVCSHVVFSSECLRQTTGVADLVDGLKRIAQHTDAFLAVSNGPGDIVVLQHGKVRTVPVFKIRAVDTLGAGDALHGGFVLALAEGYGEDEALRFGAAVAGIKCSRLGGSTGAPTRDEVEAFLRDGKVPARAL
jgi:sugar/nucleoside kinase (ribokinase family)